MKSIEELEADLKGSSAVSGEKGTCQLFLPATQEDLDGWAPTDEDDKAVKVGDVTWGSAKNLRAHRVRCGGCGYCDEQMQKTAPPAGQTPKEAIQKAQTRIMSRLPSHRGTGIRPSSILVVDADGSTERMDLEAYDWEEDEKRGDYAG